MRTSKSGWGDSLDYLVNNSSLVSQYFGSSFVFFTGFLSTPASCEHQQDPNQKPGYNDQEDSDQNVSPFHHFFFNQHLTVLSDFYIFIYTVFTLP